MLTSFQLCGHNACEPRRDRKGNAKKQRGEGFADAAGENDTFGNHNLPHGDRHVVLPASRYFVIKTS